MFYEIMKEVRIFRGLSDDELSLICSASEPFYTKFKRDDILLKQEEYSGNFGLLESGALQDIRFHIDGKTQLVRSHEPPSVVNLEGASSSRKTSPTYINATSSGKVLWFPIDLLIRNSRIPIRIREIFFANAIAYIANDSIRFLNKLDVLSRIGAEDRIKTFLRVMRRKNRNDIVNIGMNQTEFAKYLCMDRTTLTATLNKMRREGTIEFTKSEFTLNFPDVVK